MASLVSAARWQYWLVPAVAAAALAAVLVSGANVSALLALNRFGNASSGILWTNITALGDALVALTLLLPLWRRRPDLLWMALLASLITTLFVDIPKPLFNEARPPAVLGDELKVIGRAYFNHSFPSGHSATAFALAGVIALGSGWRLAYWPVVLLATLVALSRSVIGVHWPVDILSGALIGWLSACAATALARRFPAPAAKVWLQWLLGLLLIGGALTLLAGYDADYPDSRWLLRLIGLATLASAMFALYRDAKPSADNRW